MPSCLIESAFNDKWSRSGPNIQAEQVVCEPRGTAGRRRLTGSKMTHSGSRGRTVALSPLP